MDSVTEEIVVGAINEAHAKEIWSDDPRYPVVQLEWWPRKEAVTGIVRGARVRVVGAAILRVQTTEINKATGPMVLVRCKIFEAGASDWHGLIIGARALDCVEMGGLGFHPTVGGHAFTALGILMQRAEVRGGSQPQDEAYYMQVEVESPEYLEVKPGTSCIDLEDEPFEHGQFRVRAGRDVGPAPGAEPSCAREASGETPAPSADERPEAQSGDLGQCVP